MEQLIFNEENHEYLLGDKKLISVTQLMKATGLSTDYSAVSEEVLKAKAAYGTMVHKEIENFIKYGELGLTWELDEFITLLDNGFKFTTSELMVHNEEIAGTIDLLGFYNGEPIIADIKNTYTLHEEYVSWQLSIYRYLLNDSTINKGFVIWFHDEKMQFKEIALKTYEQVEEVIRCWKEGISANEQLFGIFSKNDIAKLSDVEEKIKRLDREMKEAESTKIKLLELFKEEMKKNNLLSVQNSDGSIKFTLTPEHTKKMFDSTKFKAEQPELYEKYLKESKVKESIRMTIKGA